MTGKLNKEVRCIHLAFPVPKGTLVEHVKVIRYDNSKPIYQGWADLAVGTHPPRPTLVVFHAEAFERIE